MEREIIKQNNYLKRNYVIVPVYVLHIYVLLTVANQVSHYCIINNQKTNKLSRINASHYDSSKLLNKEKGEK